MPEELMMTEAQRDEIKTLCAKAGVASQLVDLMRGAV